MPNVHLLSRSAALVAAGVLTLTACQTPAPATSTAPDEPATEEISSGGTTASGTETEIGVVPARLQFKTTTLSGAAFDGADLYGTNTILWFWAPWCPTCQAESGTVAAAQLELPDGVQLIGVPGKSDVDAMNVFVNNTGTDGFEHIVDADGSLWTNFDVAYQPAFAFIDAEGNISTLPGSLSKEGILAAAQDLLDG